MSSPTPLLQFPSDDTTALDPTTLDQAADTVEGFALQASLDALATLRRHGDAQDIRATIAAAREQALALTAQSRMVEEELADYLERAATAPAPAG